MTLAEAEAAVIAARLKDHELHDDAAWARWTAAYERYAALCRAERGELESEVPIGTGITAPSEPSVGTNAAP